MGIAPGMIEVFGGERGEQSQRLGCFPVERRSVGLVHRLQLGGDLRRPGRYGALELLYLRDDLLWFFAEAMDAPTTARFRSVWRTQSR